ncbi:uncharacterized protein METZ01_LOCUS75771 [marine metagenome]|jgi:hypothetical protein|uniref:Glycine amidinotransferase n=1 Tax=marine metagenome TaxID=408172 RepID=A0A381U6G3_9ZZZZ|tara:strand:+ start:1547 stop:2878 length:1332 start_codon:yes stop_codon:yes gene_type:complete
MNKVNSWSEFQPLEEIVIGSTFPPEFYNDVKNTQIKDCLQRIATETEEDLQKLKSTLEYIGVVCQKPSTVELGFKNNILDYCSELGEAGFYDGIQTVDPYEEDSKYLYPDMIDVYDKGRNLLPVPPLNPRDDIITMGNDILFTSNEWNFRPWISWFKKVYGDQVNLDIVENYNDHFEITHFSKCLSLQRKGYIPNDIDERPIREVNQYIEKWYQDNPDIVSTEEFRQMFDLRVGGFCAPQLTRVGKDCIVDVSERSNIIDWMKDKYSNFNYISSDIGGHNDSMFAMLKPGVVMSTFHVTYSDEIIPKSWIEICANDTVEDLATPEEWQRIKYQNHGKWWLPGEEKNKDFQDFVDIYLNHWVGEMEETVFDVNVLMVNEETMICNNYNKALFKQFTAAGIEPIVVPNRHRFFWDAGWHCVTLDIRRAGSQEDYGLSKELLAKKA